VASSAPAIVNVHTATVVTEPPGPQFSDPLLQRFFGSPDGPPRQRLETNLGSGVIVSRDGYVLTNNHVVFGASAIRVQLSDGRVTDATVVGSDPETDLAVLRIGLTDLSAVVIGSSKRLRVGDVVLAIGYPYGVGQTVTLGIVSATGRSRLGISTFENFIQTDAAINPGNSGGALVNTAGELVGINTAIFSRSGGSQGIGFAIPADLATLTLKQIIEHGRAVRGWLGIQIQNLTADLAAALDVELSAGFVVSGVLAGGPAERAGMQPGDVVTAIEGEPSGDIEAALRHIIMLEPGEQVTLSGFRSGTPMTWEAVAAERPALQAP
jgi:Do/DeqQ family serine protease